MLYREYSYEKQILEKLFRLHFDKVNNTIKLVQLHKWGVKNKKGEITNLVILVIQMNLFGMKKYKELYKNTKKGINNAINNF